MAQIWTMVSRATSRLRRLMDGGGGVSGTGVSGGTPCAPCEKAKELRRQGLGANSTSGLGTTDASGNDFSGNAVTDNDVLRRGDHVVDVVIDEHVVILDSASDRTYVLNSTAALIWLSIDGESTVRAMINQMAEDLAVDAKIIEVDIREMLSRTLDAGIAVVAPIRSDDSSADSSDDSSSSANEAVSTVVPTASTVPDVVWPHLIGPLMASGAVFEVRSNHAESAEALRGILSDLPSAGSRADTGTATRTVFSIVDDSDGESQQLQVWMGERRRWTSSSSERIVPMVTMYLNEIAVETTRDRILFHAGAVESDGNVIVIAGDSGRGKSTLTAALIQRGFRYLTDEVAAVEPVTLAVTPFPKAIDLSTESHRLVGGAVSSTRPKSISESETKTRSKSKPESATKTRSRSWSKRERKAAPGSGSAAGVTKDKTPVLASELGEISPGGKLTLLVLLGTRADAADDETYPQKVRTLIELLRCVFRPSFTSESILDSLAHLDEAVDILRLERQPLDDMCKAIEQHLAETHVKENVH